MSDKIIEDGILGIDAGGTFTDLAFICGSGSEVEAFAKTPTRSDDLLATIDSGLKIILEKIDPARIKGVNLATTLATNAIVENKIRPTGLVLIGYDPAQTAEATERNKFGTKNILMIDGGHDPKGNEKAPLDVEKLCKNLDSMLAGVESVAVSGYFSVRNPGHETRVREIIKKKAPSVYITCGHEIASDLNAILRATTAALNAGLIPIVMNLFDAVSEIFKKQGINVPISIVRSDGSLVGVEWAKEHPIETVLSGPAASAIGACHLANAKSFRRPAWVVDVGGTTTDIIYLNEHGKPGLGTEGTTVGGHKTLIKSIDIHTFGLGGDSRVTVDRDMKVVVSSRRVKSLCSTASDIKGTHEVLKHLAEKNSLYEPIIVQPGINGRCENSFEKSTLETIDGKFASMDALLDGKLLSNLGYLQLEEMEKKGLIEYSGFTPTDALHVLGKLNKWDSDASEMGAKILSRGRFKIKELCSTVCSEVVRKIALNVLKKSFLRIGYAQNRLEELESFVNFSFSDSIPTGGPDVRFSLNAALIGVGAPAWAFLKQTGELIGEDAILPENAEVAGAVGAAVGTFSLRYSVWITPLPNGSYRAHLPSGIHDFASLKESVDNSVEFMRPWIIERAQKSGAIEPVVDYKQEDEEAWVQGGLRKVHLWTQLLFNVSDATELEEQQIPLSDSV